jgi:hypothetical protein
MIKKQSIVALVLFLLIPPVLGLGGMLFSLINPEIAAGHPNYARNWHLLNLLKNMCSLASAGVVAVLWLLVCLMVIRSKQRSLAWLFLAALGPLGLAVLAMLNDRAPAERDRYARFVRGLNGFARGAWELCTFVMIWVLAYEAMVLTRTLRIWIEAATTGTSVAQIVNIQNASSGMWAFAEGNEVMYLVVLFYLLWPMVFCIVGKAAARMAPARAR